MPQLNMAQVRQISENLGHARPGVRQSRRGWSGVCGCGFTSPRVPLQAQAEQLVTDHVMRVVQTWLAKQKASGRTLQEVVSTLESQAS
jgi:hypothetical protein